MVIYIPDPISVEDLAGMLETKPFNVVAELMMVAGYFCTARDIVDFNTASKIAAAHGFEPKRHAAHRPLSAGG